jgi:adenosylmethionine-8-amino-7-oxononanoate aminotransferase
VILRALRDAIAICPPLIIDEDQIESLFDAPKNGLGQVHARLAEG